MHRDYKYIIDSVFDKDFFTDKGSEATVENIQSHIKAFNRSFPNLSRYFLDNLKSEFPNALIENYTQFFNNDRCIRFLVQINDQERYVLQIGIFEIFSIYKHSYKIMNNKYQYDEVFFIDKGEVAIADKFYHCLPTVCEHFEWLEREFLNQEVSAFSNKLHDKELSHIVKVADLLFTSHYI